MVAKRKMRSLFSSVGLNLAKIHMVAKHKPDSFKQSF